MREKGVKIISVSDSEQSRLACSFVPLESGTIFHYDTALDQKTRKNLESEGVEIIPFHPDCPACGRRKPALPYPEALQKEKLSLSGESPKRAR